MTDTKKIVVLLKGYPRLSETFIAQEIAGESEENKRAAGRGKRMSFRVAHAQEWGEVILDSFGRTVAEGLQSSASERPAVGGTKWPPED